MQNTSIHYCKQSGLKYYRAGQEDALLTMILLHGYGAPGHDLVGLSTLMGDLNCQFLFPEAPIDLGFGGARGWFHLPSSLLDGSLKEPLGVDFSFDDSGVAKALESMETFISSAHKRLGWQRLVIGGFSQGAMVSLHLSLRPLEKLCGGLFFSGTGAGLGKRVADIRLKPMPYFISHGKMDTVLPFSGAESLHSLLRENGWEGTNEWFDGGHEIPNYVAKKAEAFLKKWT